MVRIGNKTIGAGNPTFVIAEAGVNHNGDINLAERLVDVAVHAGVDAVKFQSFTTERIVTVDAPKAQYQLATTGAAQSQYEMLKSLELSRDDQSRLHAYCSAKGILFLSSPFDYESADFLDDLGVPAFKIPSGEITNVPFLEHIARKQKPMIVSTGMSHLSEVDEAVRAIVKTGSNELVLLHCVSNYPADPGEVNLRAMHTMAVAFQMPIGYSDHTLGREIALAAVALGATVVEKHFTLDRTMAGPDHKASIEPDELASLVRAIRNVEKALGDGSKRPSAGESSTAEVARKSLVSAVEIPSGTALTAHMIAIKRPGTGLAPAMLPYVIGRRVKTTVPPGKPLTNEDLE